MKNQIKFMLLWFVSIGTLLTGCNQYSDKSTKEFNLECARLKGIRETLDQKNKIIYDSINYTTEKYNSLFPDNKDITNELKVRTNEVEMFIQELKIEILRAVDGEESSAINGQEINTTRIIRLNNKIVPSKILIGNDDGKSLDLKAILQDYQSYLNIIAGADSILIKNINSELSTDDQKIIIPGKNTEQIAEWQKLNFQAKPVGSVIITLTQIQNSVKNAESEVLSFIHNGMNDKLKLQI